MKTVANKKTQKWPMIQVCYYGPKKSKIISAEEAIKKFGLERSTYDSMCRGFTYGVGCKKVEGVEMLRRYTRNDSVRDASEDLLKALLGMVACSPCRNGCKEDELGCATRAAEAVIKKAERN